MDNDFISRQAMIADLKNKQEAMSEANHHDNAKIAGRMIGYVEDFPAAEKPAVKQACWTYSSTDNVFLVDIHCPICGELAMYPEDEDRPLETPFCPHCGIPMSEDVPLDPSWPYAMMSKRMEAKMKQEQLSKE